MVKIIDKIQCCGCYACFNICSKGCIEMYKDEDGFLYPRVDESLCINCGLCEKACPILNQHPANSIPIAYAAYTKNDEIRMTSSAGGIFSLLSEKVIEQGGIVFGATFDEKYNVKHFEASNLQELKKLRCSKYVQSKIDVTYKSAQKYLDEGKIVYFSGTPCQIEGLLCFLKKDYDRLITQDIICHGVPSEQVWERYKARFGELNCFSFRDKSSGWRNYSIKANDEVVLASKSSYMSAFIAGYSLRPSCYDCKFCNTSRNSDITLGDLWGANEFVPEMNDNKGLSLVVINSEKGRILFESVDAVKQKIDFQDAIVYNPSYVKPTPKPKNRDEFMKEVTIDNFDKLVFEKYSNVSNKKSIKRLIKRLIKRQIKI